MAIKSVSGEGSYSGLGTIGRCLLRIAAAASAAGAAGGSTLQANTNEVAGRALRAVECDGNPVGRLAPEEVKGGIRWVCPDPCRSLPYKKFYEGGRMYDNLTMRVLRAAWVAPCESYQPDYVGCDIPDLRGGYSHQCTGDVLYAELGEHCPPGTLAMRIFQDGVTKEGKFDAAGNAVDNRDLKCSGV